MPNNTSKSKLLHRSTELRQNQTEAEALLWRYLRGHRFREIHFRRQHVIGNFIVDFCSPRQKIIIELDGSQHLDHQEYDEKRSAFFAARGYRILRFWNNDVIYDIEGVMRAIELSLTDG